MYICNMYIYIYIYTPYMKASAVCRSLWTSHTKKPPAQKRKRTIQLEAKRDTPGLNGASGACVQGFSQRKEDFVLNVWSGTDNGTLWENLPSGLYKPWVKVARECIYMLIFGEELCIHRERDNRSTCCQNFELAHPLQVPTTGRPESGDHWQALARFIDSLDCQPGC